MMAHCFSSFWSTFTLLFVGILRTGPFIATHWEEILEVYLGEDKQVQYVQRVQKHTEICGDESRLKMTGESEQTKARINRGWVRHSVTPFSLIIPLRFTSLCINRSSREWLCTVSLFYNSTCASSLRGIFKEQGLFLCNYHKKQGTMP